MDKKKDDTEYYFEKERKQSIVNSCNTIIMSNSIMLIPLVIVLIEVLKELPEVRVLSIIFGLSLIGVLLVSTFLSILAGQIDTSINDLEVIKKNNNTRHKLLFSSYICTFAFYVLLAASILVIMIVM